VPIVASMTFSFDDRMLMTVVAAMILALAVTLLRTGRGHAAPRPPVRSHPACPGDPWCPGPTWHILLPSGAESAAVKRG
jgi:hypothetical protein